MIILIGEIPIPIKVPNLSSFHHLLLKTSQEYRLICEGLGRTVEQAIDAQSFLRLVNEDEPGMTGLNHPVK